MCCLPVGTTPAAAAQRGGRGLFLAGWLGALALSAAVWIGAARLAFGHGIEFSPAEIAWLNRQRALDGTKCCDETDAHVGMAVEWRMRGGHYEVRITGEWRRVPPGRVMRHDPADPTPWPGQALLFWSPQVWQPGGYSLWCFYPEPLM